MGADFLARLAAAAEAEAGAESDYHAESRRRLEALARARTRAYRRYNLLKDMADLAKSQTECAAAVRVQCDFAAADCGWAEGADGYAEFRAEFEKVAQIVFEELQPGIEKPDSALENALAAFETWYRGRFGADFLDRVQRDITFYPKVDF
jgi:hypothetical protein